MLRESSIATNTRHDLRAITDRTIDPRVPNGTALLDLVDAVLNGTDADVAASRTALVTEMGHDALVDAAAVFATFEMMNRVADGTGIPVSRNRLATTTDIRTTANLDALRHD